jgi:hypothetical protein
MRRIAVTAVLTIMLAIGFLPAANSVAPTERSERTVTLEGAGELLGPGAPEDLTVRSDGPEKRAEAWLPQDPGTKKWITLDYGPYTIHPGSDLSRLDEEIVGQMGYAVGFEPSVVDVNGDPLPNHQIHIHHAHWLWLDPEQEGYHRWFYGTGEERTQGSLIPRAKADPRFRNGLRYGVKLEQGDRIGFLSMLHNKTAEPIVVYLRVRIEYVYGNHDSIKEAKGWNFHNLTPALIGTTFNVPRTGDVFTFPLDTTKETIGPYSNYHNPIDDSKVKPGVGQVVTMPYSGTIIVGGGHSHPGAKEIVLSNLGRKNAPCPNDGDRFPGVTAARSRNITYQGVFGSEDYQHGVTQDGWRMYLRKGDRLVLNGVYDGTNYSFPDAMSYFGMYTDQSEPPKRSQVCKVELINDQGASQDQIVRTVRNQKWPKETAPVCRNCDDRDQKPEPGPETNLVHIAGFSYLPGNQGVEGDPGGPPVVTKGDELTFINEDYALGGVRHSVTSCKAPCNGPYSANYPLHDGEFHSGALGYTWQETYINAKDEPRWSLDTSKVKPGLNTYYCQLHPWMRGSFYVKK